MKILLIMDPGIPVPPPLYGGHERLAAMFIDEYTRQGHQVTLLAGPDSIAPAVDHFGKNLSYHEKSILQSGVELIEAWRYLLNNSSKFDLIHNFGRLLYLLPILNRPVKKIMTYGREVTQSAIKRINLLPTKNLVFTGCSNYCVSTGNIAGRWETVYNAIDFSKYTCQEKIQSDAPLMFLGRIEQIKGVHTAIELAKATGHKLWIGGNIPSDQTEYFKQRVQPHIDNEQIIYLGALNDNQKNEYLGQAKALLFPIEWNEPFGMVMVEAMACGTPVIAFKKGSTPEVISNGNNGFYVDSFEEFISRIKTISEVNRVQCRIYAENRFDVKVIATHYLNL